MTNDPFDTAPPLDETDQPPESAPAAAPLDAEPQPSSTPARAASFGAWVRGWFSRGDERERLLQRMANLDHAIEHTPETASNYLLRGEVHMALGDTEAARADFEQALALADAELAESEWGFIAQSTRDRVLVWLGKLGK